jgi:hypothetical protein
MTSFFFLSLLVQPAAATPIPESGATLTPDTTLLVPSTALELRESVFEIEMRDLLLPSRTALAASRTLENLACTVEVNAFAASLASIDQAAQSVFTHNEPVYDVVWPAVQHFEDSVQGIKQTCGTEEIAAACSQTKGSQAALEWMVGVTVQKCLLDPAACYPVQPAILGFASEMDPVLAFGRSSLCVTR